MTYEFYDLNTIDTKSFSFKLENGILKNISNSYNEGSGIRYYYNNARGYISTNNINDKKNIYIENARNIAKNIYDRKHNEVNIDEVNNLQRFSNINDKIYNSYTKINPFDISSEDKINLFKEVDKYIINKNIKTRNIYYFESRSTHEYRNSDNLNLKSTITRVGYSINSIAKDGTNFEVSNKYKYEISGYELIHNQNPFDTAKEAVDLSINLLNAKKIKSNYYNVILDPQLTGVFTHEAFGHSSEADLCLKGDSSLSKCFGKEIATNNLNVVDDPTIKGYGHYLFDFDGIQGKKHYLIKNGLYDSLMHSKESLSRMNTGTCGNSRAQFNCIPQVRMSNTYIENGDSSFDEMINDMKNGIYLVGSRGGQVDTGSGKFQFNAENGYEVKNGELTNMIKNVSLTGSIIETLKNISLIGNDCKLFSGYCGKDGQIVPVSDGGPHINITKIAVGGI